MSSSEQGPRPDHHVSNLEVSRLQPGQGGHENCRGDVVNDCSVESEDVECLQTEILCVQQCGQEGLDSVRAEIRSQAEAVPRDVQVPQL